MHHRRPGHLDHLALDDPLANFHLALVQVQVPGDKLLTVLDDDECKRLMNEFIKRNPDLWNQDIGVE